MAMDTTAALEKAASGMAKAADIEGLQNFIKSHYGDYSKLAKMNRRELNKVFPISSWMAHATQMITHIPFSYPFKVAFTRILGGEAAKQYGTNKYGEVPVRLATGELAKGVNNSQLWFRGIQMDTLEAGANLMQMAAQALFNTGEPWQVPSPVSPALSTYQGFSTGIDPQNKKPFVEEHPDIIKVRGRLFNTKERRLLDKKEQVQPHLLLQAGRNIFPKQVVEAQRAIAFPFQPSPYTAPGDPKPKTFMRRPQKASRVEEVLRLLRMAAREGEPLQGRVERNEQR